MGWRSTKPLSCGVSTDDFSDDNESKTESDVPLSSVSSVIDPGIEDHTKSSASQSDCDKGSSDRDSCTSDSSGKKGSNRKRSQRGKRVPPNPVPNLTDNKRKHLEHQLSASQRDQLLMNESKEDSQFKKDIADAIRQSNKTFAQSMQQMSMSMLQVAQGFTRSFEFLARAMVNNPDQPPYEYRPYHQSNDIPGYGPVHPTGYTQPNISYQEQAYTYESSQNGMDNNGNKHFHSL